MLFIKTLFGIHIKPGTFDICNNKNVKGLKSLRNQYRFIQKFNAKTKFYPNIYKYITVNDKVIVPCKQYPKYNITIDKENSKKYRSNYKATYTDSDEECEVYKYNEDSYFSRKTSTIGANLSLFEKPSKLELTITGRIISSNQIMDIYKYKINSDFDTINVLCTHKLFLDSDIKMPGKNLNIICENLSVLKGITISLKGKNGKAIFTLKAASGQETYSNGTGIEGTDGKPGKPGGNGGNILICVNNPKKIVKLFSIDTSGGDGGVGQNGGNGYKGKGGANGCLNDVSQRKSNCLIRSKIINERDAVDDFSSLTSKCHRTYRSYGKCGKPGGNAGKGGAGGKGGASGEIHLHGISKDQVKIYNYRGATGQNGKAGKPGKGGYYGDDYEGKYLTYKLGRGYDKDVGKKIFLNALIGISTLGISTVYQLLYSTVECTMCDEWIISPHKITNYKRGRSGSRAYRINFKNIISPKEPTKVVPDYILLRLKKRFAELQAKLGIFAN